MLENSREIPNSSPNGSQFRDMFWNTVVLFIIYMISWVLTLVRQLWNFLVFFFYEELLFISFFLLSIVKWPFYRIKILWQYYIIILWHLYKSREVVEVVEVLSKVVL